MHYNGYNNIERPDRPHGADLSPAVIRNDRSQAESAEAPASPAKKKRGLGLRIGALCLAFALAGGLIARTGVFSGRLFRGRTTLREGTHTPTVVTVSRNDAAAPLTVPQIYASNVNSVVGINVGITTNVWGRETTTPASGTGFVIAENGYILTNYHVIEDASTIEVDFVNGDSYPAKLVGGEAENDIAVLKVEATGLAPVTIGDSDQLVVGEQVVAIGNPLGELTYSLTGGYVSALDRNITMSDGTVMNMLQTDAAINNGNSGGPLFNIYGQVIGITTAKYSSTSSIASSATATIEGLGFAIPINDVKALVTDIIEHGYVTGKPFLGVQIDNVSSSVQRYGVPAGAELTLVTPGLCADKAGLKEGDIVTAIDGAAVATSSDFTSAIRKHRAGDTVEFTLYRDGETSTLRVTLDEETAENAAARDAYIEEHTQQTASQSRPGYYSYGDPFEFFGWR